MAIETLQGGGHIDTPFPEGNVTRRRPRPPLDTPDPSRETAPSATLPREPRCWQLRQRSNPFFMGRERVLQQLHQQFQHHTVCHLRGPLGSGTTQSALAYTFRARGSFDAVFWLDASDEVSLRFDAAHSIDDLGLVEHDERGHRERLGVIAGWLDSHDQWLIVADGITDYAPLKALLPPRIRGKVLLTGHRDLGESSIGVVEHGPLEDTAACRFLEHRSQQPDAAGRDEIVLRLEGSTLPLYLAGAYCHSTGTKLEDYDVRLEKALNTAINTRNEDRSQAAIRAVVEQSLQFASEQNPAALELMALCAHFNSESIPLVMLYDGAPFLPRRLGTCVTEPKALDQTLSLLYRLGLILFEQNGITLHPQVQCAIRNLLGEEQGGAWLMTALRVVLEAFPVESHYAQPVPLCSLLVPHALVVAELSEQADNLHENTGALLNQVGLYLHSCDELDCSRACLERAITQAIAHHGTTAHPTVASRTNSLGVVLQDQKRYEEARDCYQRAFELCEAIYGPASDAAMGPAHRSMLTTPSRNLCQVFELMGDITAAKSAYARAIDTFIAVYAWNHPLVAESMNGLGQLHCRAGEWRQAQQFFLKAIQAEENAEEPALGALSIYTRNLAQCLIETRQIAEAQKFFEHALVCDREDFGAAHERIATGFRGLARCHRIRSRFEEAHQCLDDAMAVLNVLADGPTLSKAVVWRQKGRCHLDTDDNEEAMENFQTALRTAEAAVGQKSDALGPDYVYLSRALNRLERYADAEQALLNALQLHEADPWLDDEGLNVLYNRLIRVYRTQQNFARAAHYQTCVLEDHRKRFGDSDDRVAADAYSLGNLYGALGDMNEGERYLQLALDIYTKSRGPDDERTGRVRRKLEAIERAGNQGL